jgi:formylglycine-generating enzyme required for sulfatase activity
MQRYSKGIGITLVFLLAVLTACTPPITTSPSPSPKPLSVPSPTSSFDCQEIGQTRLSATDGMTLVCVPSGDFWMGADESDTQAQPDEKPRHLVSLDAFWIDRTEVTNTMFAMCVAAGVCHERKYSPYLWGVYLPNGTPYYGEATYRDDPVIMLDSDEAQAYCLWAGRRLPSEAEWEKAARGTDGRLYPWGASLDCEYASYLGCEKEPGDVTSHPLGVSPYGALNMSGNLWEWVSDWYNANYYSQSPAQNPHGPASGEFRVIRGGGWHSNPAQLRATNRSTGKPEHSTDGEIGFRCAMDDSSPK